MGIDICLEFDTRETQIGKKNWVFDFPSLLPALFLVKMTNLGLSSLYYAAFAVSKPAHLYFSGRYYSLILLLLSFVA